MTDRSRRLSYENAGYLSGKMVNVNDLSPRKTMIVLVIVVGCFAVLWPKVFYPMLVGSANNRIKPSAIDRTQGCCDVISEKDVTTLKLMSEICDTIIKSDSDKPMSNKELLQKCQNLVLDTCGIDISAVLQEQVRLGHTTKQILEEVRSLNGSLCLKYNFGIAPWKLGVPHRVTVKVSPSSSIRQERPLHLRSEMVHPAFRERGRAIPQAEFAPTKPAPPSRLIPKIVDGRPGPIPGMRPTIGGAGHVVPAKQGGTSMGLIMPIYTVGIVIFFTYTVMKIVFKKQPEVLYPPLNPDPHFRREVFEADRGHLSSRSKESSSSKLGDNELDQLRRRLRETEMAMERIVEQMAKVPLKFQEEVVANGSLLNQEDDQSSVQVLGMETTASRENGQKWTRSGSPSVPAAHPHLSDTPPQEIFLEGSLPPQSHLLVTDSATEAQKVDAEEDPAVVLAGKMTLSVISLDSSENGTDESSNSGKKNEDRSSSNVSEEFEKIDMAQLEEQIDNIIAEAEGGSPKETEIELLKEPEESSQFVARETEECVKQIAEAIDSGYPERGQEFAENKDEAEGKKGIISKESSQFVARETEECIKQIAEAIDSGYPEREQESTENKDEAVGKEDITTESKQQSSLASVESLIAEKVDAVNETFQDKQKELDELLSKTDETLTKSTEYIDDQIEQIERDLIKIKEREEMAVEKDNLPEPKEVKEIIDEIKEEYVIEEVIIPATSKELEKNNEQEVEKVSESNILGSQTSDAIVEVDKKRDRSKISAEGEDKPKEGVVVQQTTSDTVEDVVEVSKKILEKTTEEVDSTLLKSSNEDILPQVKSDIERQEKDKTDSTIKKEEFVEEPADVEDIVEVEGEDYVLESDEEVEEDENEEVVLQNESKLGAVLQANSQVQQQAEDDDEVEYDEEYEEESEDENGEEIEQEVVEYISDEEEEVEEVEEEEEEEGEEDEKVVSHV
ncbi:golgin subfamily A member 6-like protein 1 isoform X3 [Diabrotica virgifera virgifera]|uniref:Resistance to inhibitors of cholinesterase protein 3 N-terminal domain-containing protein n=1 Tax=Diabrotica virgifera virgifera TaxID=50390 RepID=A0ABM5KJE2_DIAVI|nr:golgin subfamily A member 6-like protein 1 isoform X3 [Diabrotica virgifera virgifera]